MISYAIKRSRKYLQGIEPNEEYCSTSCAPTMGNRHIYNQFNSVWGAEPKYFERLTANNYMAVILEEYRWKSKKPIEIKIIPKVEE